MTALSYTAAGGNLAGTMKKVCGDHDPFIITRPNAEPVVMLSLEDYEALCETGYLLQNPGNAQRLLESIGVLSAGNGQERETAE